MAFNALGSLLTSRFQFGNSFLLDLHVGTMKCFFSFGFHTD